MSLTKITDLTKQLGLSSRTLRYYEQEGLLESTRMPYESYRYYDELAVQRLRQIMILRKMQIPVREIIRIYENPEISTLVEVFTDKIAEIDREVTALSELKEIINTFLREMTEKGIKKISALPLLYEEMEKQTKLLEGQILQHAQAETQNPDGQDVPTPQHRRAQSNGASPDSPSENDVMTGHTAPPELHVPPQSPLHQLNRLQDQLAAPPDTAILLLPSMRVLTSCLRQSGESDIPGFWHTVQALNLSPGLPGGHEQFEFQNGPEGAVMLRIDEHFQNDTDYLDDSFPGGLYAAANLYVDEGLEEQFHRLEKALTETVFMK